MQAIKISEIVSSIEEDFTAIPGASSKRIPRANSDNWKDVLESLKISPTDIYEAPPVCIEIADKNGKARFGSIGNFSAIIGKAKSRKTFFIAYLVSFILKNSSSDDKIVINLSNDKKTCLVFDTEQSNADISQFLKRVYKLAAVGLTDNIETYGLRVLPPAERLFVIERKLYAADNLGIVVIDGIRDLISDINSAEEATMITSKLLKWTEELNIHIIVVLHQNKADNNARGHLGTEIINKSESVISIEKDDNISVVKSEFCRGIDFAPFAFSISDAGLPYVIDDWTPKAKKEGRKRPAPFEIPKETHFEILKNIFTETDSQMNRKALESNLSVQFKKMSMGLTNTELCEYIAYYQQNKFLLDTGGKGRLGNRFYLNNEIIK